MPDTQRVLSTLKDIAGNFAASLPEPRFFADLDTAHEESARILSTTPSLLDLKCLLKCAAENLGHGLEHSMAVARDAGIIVRAEAEKQGLHLTDEEKTETIVAVQAAAILHDIKRTERNHAQAGAAAARDILSARNDIPARYTDAIVTAITNHEAFKPAEPLPDAVSQLISDALYDADKFRWGPDNFTHTLWLMIAASGRPDLHSLHRRFLQNLDYIRRISPTFRTDTGRRYGPEFIDQGISIGQVIFKELSARMDGPRMELVTDLEAARGCCEKRGVITLGNFDGLHLGHQELIRRVVTKAREIDGVSIAFTFHPHPLKVLSPAACPPLLSTYEEKVAMFEELGIDLLLMIPFTREIAGMSARDFAKKILKETLNAVEIFVGFNYRFGRGREGTVAVLREMGKELGFNVTELPEVAFEGEVISSTKIRDLLRAGEVEHAARLLGRPYAITGRVVGGDKRGRTLGFPTANVEPVHEIMPYPGVYAVRASIDGKQHDGVVNAGFRPTFNKKELCLEVFLMDFNEDIYGKEITVFFVRKIRDERRFESLEALADQIGRDVDVARGILREVREVRYGR